MALQSSGAISLDDIHVEVDGSTGSTCSINDSDIRGLIDKSDGATSAFNEFYGAANITYMNASGGTTSTSGNYRFHKFTSSGTFAVSAVASGGASATVDYLIIAGGGAGGLGTGSHFGGGGGAGGYKTGTVSVSSTGNNTITIGGGQSSIADNASGSAFGTTFKWYNVNPSTSSRGTDSSALGVTSTGGGQGGGAHGASWNDGDNFGNPVTGGSGSG